MHQKENQGQRKDAPCTVDNLPLGNRSVVAQKYFCAGAIGIMQLDLETLY